MKTRAILVGAIFLAAAAAIRAAPFEGLVHLQRAERPELPHDIIYRVKGEKNRVDVSRERVATFLTDTAKGKTTVILEDDMAYLVMPSLVPLSEVPELEPTGETTTMLGQAVKKYLVTTYEGTAELWLAEGFGPYTGFGEGFERPPEHIPNVDVPEAPGPQGWEYALLGTGLFPLQVVARDEFGREFFRLEAKAITPQPLSDRLFVPTSTYREVETWPKPL